MGSTLGECGIQYLYQIYQRNLGRNAT
uniref:Uncharacterized protein n=1 Tax=Arundo donax TaxID=35708 RepID=A0A0A9FL56_ARUDO